VRRELERVNRECLEPSVPIHYLVREVDGRRVLEARVQRALSRPVMVYGPDGDVRVYVRERSSSRPANESEIRLLRRGPEDLQLDGPMRRLLDAIQYLPRPTAADAARGAGMGLRKARPLLRKLCGAGLVGEKDGQRLWITPSGYRVLRGL